MRVLRRILFCACVATALAGCADDASYPAGAAPTQPQPGQTTGGTLPRDGGTMNDGGTGTIPTDAGPLSGDGGGLGNDASPPTGGNDGGLPGPDAGGTPFFDAG
jgi:hypothetical protein